jgi:hypothetical protein
MARRRSRREWRQIVLKWQQSGLKKAAFARRNGVNLKTFEFWCWALKAELLAITSPPRLQLLPVRVSDAPTGSPRPSDGGRAVVDLSGGGLRVEFSLDADPRNVAELIAALRAKAC